MKWLKNLILTKEEKYWIEHGRHAIKSSFLIGMKVGEKHTFNMADHYRFGGLSLSPEQICDAKPRTYSCGKIKALSEVPEEFFPALWLGVDKGPSNVAEKGPRTAQDRPKSKGGS